MIRLKVNPEKPDQLQLQERLKELSLAHQLILSENLIEPELEEGDQSLTGIVSIHQHIDELEKVLSQWYDCRCDK